MDADGAVTAADTVLVIEQTILSSFGDTNGDKQSDVADTGQVADAFTNTGDNIPTDLNGDGVVDGIDLALSIASLGNVIAFDTQLVALALYDLVLQYETLEDAGQLQVTDNLVVLANNYPAGDHGQAVSHLYDLIDHGGGTSKSWPGNHLPAITANRVLPDPPIGRHGTLNSRDEAWPANHIFDISKDWTPQWIWPGHNLTVSRDQVDRPKHENAVSRLWHPNHLFEVSGSYPNGEHEVDTSENPPAHTVEVSRIWPANHDYQISIDHVWPHEDDHHPSISQSWSHQAESSATWPPSHVPHVSETWAAQQHAIFGSVGWPPSHSSYASGEWPPNTYPGTWPPNHQAGVSSSWGDPPPIPPGFIPADHAYIPSGRWLLP